MLQRIKDALQTLQDEQAHSALNRSTIEGDPAFAFGRATGIHQGIQMALDAVIRAIQADEVEDDDHAPRRRGETYLRT